MIAEEHRYTQVDRGPHIELYDSSALCFAMFQLLYLPELTLHFKIRHQNRKGGSAPCIIPSYKKMKQRITLLGLGASGNQV